MIRGGCSSDSLAMGMVYSKAWKAAYRGIVPDAFLDSLTAVNAAPPAERISPETCLVYEKDGSICALVRFGKCRDADITDMAEIYSIYVLPECWHGGIGTALFEAALKALRDGGAAGVYLWTLKENARARGFYERMGMMCIGEREIEIAGKKLNECRYELIF